MMRRLALALPFFIYATAVLADDPTASSTDVVGVFARYGLPGLIILFMGWGSYKAISRLFDQLITAKDEQIKMGQELTKVLQLNTVSQDGNTQILKGLNDRVAVLDERIRTLTDQMRSRGM